MNNAFWIKQLKDININDSFIKELLNSYDDSIQFKINTLKNNYNEKYILNEFIFLFKLH